MKIKLFLFSLLFLFCIYLTDARKRHHDSDEDEEEKDIGNPAMDRLAVNLAGAFVKSLFPDMDRGSAPAPSQATMGSRDAVVSSNPADVRRAPQHAALLQEASGPAYETMNAFNSRYGGSGGPASPVLSAVNGGNYGLQLPESAPSYGPGAGAGGLSGLSGLSGLPLPTSQLADLIPNMPDTLNAGSGGIEAINAARRQKYLAELERHQHELNVYGAKQMEYLDQQRRYQQSMVDHQAGAALLLQQQQQEYLTGMKKKYAGFEDLSKKTDSQGLPDLQTGGHILRRAKNPVQQHAVRTAAQEAFENKNDSEREAFASDEYLKGFFKKSYGIEIPDDDQLSKLSEDDRDVLKKLKEHLINEARGQGLKLGAINTMEKFAEKHTEEGPLAGEDLEKELAELENKPANETPLDEARECHQCLSITPKKLKGSWTQIYGNPTIMKETYSTILSLKKMEQLDNSRETTNVSGNHATCVGMEIGSVRHGESRLNVYFRDDGDQKGFHEMNGSMILLSNKEAKFSLDYMDTRLCIVKAGPADESKFEYVIFAETNGKNKCKSHFVFARNYDEFKLRYYDDVADYMKTQVINDEALPVAALPDPENCQLLV